MDKRFIEERFPVKEVSKESAREKNIYLGNISTLHIWWARKPLAVSRTTNYASLIPYNNNNSLEIKDFIIKLSNWENSFDDNIINKSKKDILENFNNKKPKVLDPFAGGGSIPLESLRLGCDTYAGDYNPLSVLLNKCVLEFPQKFKNKLVNKLESSLKTILHEMQEDLGEFYPNFVTEGYFGEGSKIIPISYIWSNTIKCQNPNCEAEIPLMTQYWLAKKKNKKVALKPYFQENKILFDVVGDGYDPIQEDFDPSKGTISRALVTCPICNTTIDSKDVRKDFLNDKTGQRMVAIVLNPTASKGKLFRIATDKDIEDYQNAERYLIKKTKELTEKWEMEPIPQEEIPLMSGTFNVPLYGISKWGDLFNSRQKLVIISFIDKAISYYREHKKDDEELYKAIISIMGILLGKMLDYSSVLCSWDNTTELIKHTFVRPALGMMWTYAESNPFSMSTGSIHQQQKYVLSSISNIVKTSKEPAFVFQASATEIPFDENFFDAVFTDPPYYNSVPYADLSDFFYVWLKRLMGSVYPSLFATPLTPKGKELAEMASWDKKRYSHKTKEYFETNLNTVFNEIYRVLKPEGITTIVYAHKTTEGWETVINALLDSGLIVTASWPLHTEMTMRPRSMGSAALASSIYIVARKFEKQGIGWYNEVREEIKDYVPKKLDKLWEEGISGADFFIAAIGSSIEIFGKYEKIMDNQGNEIRANKLLSFVRDVVTDYTVRHILHNGIADELSPLTKFYLLWRWNYIETRVTFDEARKLAQSAGIDLTNEWNKGFIKKNGEYIIVVGPEKRNLKSLKNSIELIDVLHRVCILWKDGNTDDMKSLLKTTGYGNKEAFYKVSQAISETLPDTSTEKKLIDGFLAGRDRIMQDMHEDNSNNSQTKLL